MSDRTADQGQEAPCPPQIQKGGWRLAVAGGSTFISGLLIRAKRLWLATSLPRRRMAWARRGRVSRTRWSAVPRAIRTRQRATDINVFSAAPSWLQVGRAERELRNRNIAMSSRARPRLPRWSLQTAGRIHCPRSAVRFPPSAGPE
jgi:hypothetical protein